MNRRTERLLLERQQELQARANEWVAQQAPSAGTGSNTQKMRTKVTCTMLNETEKQLLRVRNRASWMQSAGARQ